jgi:thiol-disulfide isomerase/thioredoxin
LIDFAGLQELVDQQAGKITLIDIWSTSCLPCMREFPNLVELSKQYPDKLTCVSLNVDYIGLPNKPPESYQEKVLAFLEKQAATEIHNYLATEPDTDILDKANAESMPAILIYDTEGELVATLTDATAGEEGLSYEGTVIPKLHELLDAQ